MDYAVEGTDLGVPEGGERRQLGARWQCLAEVFFSLRDRARLQAIGAKFDDHGGSFLAMT
jgi:hypothetical protein